MSVNKLTVDCVLGFDGGGTSTRACLLALDGKVLAQGKAGPSSIDTVSLEKCETSLREALRAAQETLPNTELNIKAAMAGLGGTVSLKDEISVQNVLKNLPGLQPGAPVKAANDMKIALAGGTALKPGIITIIGTGSGAYGKNAQGFEHKAGGWGWKEGDPGSSFDLGISAIRAYVRAGDGRSETNDFTKAVKKELGIASVDEITRLLYQEDLSRTQIAALAPLVTTWADKANPQALAIVNRACADLRDMIKVVFEKVFVSGQSKTAKEKALGSKTVVEEIHGGEPVELVFIGSLGNAPGVFNQTLSLLVNEISPRIKLIKARKEPVEGAALWALSLLDKP